MPKRDSCFASHDLETLFSSGTVGGFTDAQLVEIVASRRDDASELAFAALLDRHGPMVLRVCRSVLRDSHDADDAFQATFLVLVEKARVLWVRESLGPWLHQVAHRVSSCARSAVARRRQHERHAALSAAQVVAARAPDDLGEVLHEEVRRLPDRYRTAVVLCLLEGHTPEQAARHLGWPVGTVHSRLARGRAQLRSRLARRGLVPEGVGRDPMDNACPPAVPAALLSATMRAAARMASGNTVDGVAATLVAASIKGGLETKMMAKLMVAVASVVLSVATAAAFPFFQSTEKLQESSPPNIPRPQPPQPAVNVVHKQDVRDPSGRAHSLAISPDGAALAAGCTDGSVHLLDARTGEERVTLSGVTKGYIHSLRFTPDGRTLVGVDFENQLRLWDATSGKPIKTLPALGDLEKLGFPRTSPQALAVSGDGALVAVGGGGSTEGAVIRPGHDSLYFEIRILDVRTGSLVWSHLGRRESIGELAFSPDGTKLASTNVAEIKLWDARTGDLLRSFRPRAGYVWALAFSPDNQLLAGFGAVTGGGRRTSGLTLWDLRSGAIVHSIDAGEMGGAVAHETLAFSPDGKTLASAGSGVKTGRISIGGGPVGLGTKLINHVKLWDVRTGAPVWTSAEGDLGDITSLVFSPDGKSLYCCDNTATTRIDVETGQVRQDLMRAVEVRPR